MLNRPTFKLPAALQRTGMLIQVFFALAPLVRTQDGAFPRSRVCKFLPARVVALRFRGIVPHGLERTRASEVCLHPASASSNNFRMRAPFLSLYEFREFDAASEATGCWLGANIVYRRTAAKNTTKRMVVKTEIASGKFIGRFL